MKRTIALSLLFVALPVLAGCESSKSATQNKVNGRWTVDSVTDGKTTWTDDDFIKPAFVAISSSKIKGEGTFKCGENSSTSLKVNGDQLNVGTFDTTKEGWWVFCKKEAPIYTAMEGTLIQETPTYLVNGDSLTLTNGKNKMTLSK